MTALRLEGFAGIAPRMSERLLPQQGATVAKNAKLISGELRGLHELKLIRDLNAQYPSIQIRRAFRIPANINIPIPISPADFWMAFESENVDLVRSPLTSDAFDRHYWTGDTSLYGGVPKYNTRARILAGDPPYRLGVPAPVSGPAVAPPSGTTETRAYVYTFVSSFGEEGQPSPPVLATGAVGTWNLSGMATTVPNPTERSITHKNIYRTVPGFTSSEFYFVAQVPIATATYADSASSETVAANRLLESTTWAPPPDTLQGVVVHPGGFLCGFSGRDLYISEPFRPHAWPVEYILTMQTEIVALAIYNNSVVVLTNSRPYVIDGTRPDSMTPNKIDSIDPCISRRSAVTTLEGVYYATPQGIALITPGGVALRTSDLFTREEWYGRYNPAGIKAVQYGMQYIAFDRPDSGFIFSPAERLAPLSELDRFNGVEMIQIDQYSGDVYVIRGKRVLEWDPLDTVPYEYQWKSKVFDFPRPVNFGALRIKFRSVTQDIDEDSVAEYITFNTARIATQLNTINSAPIGGVRRITLAGWPEAQNKSPVAGSPLYGIPSLLTLNPTVTIRVSARNVSSEMETIAEFTASDEGVYRLPSGFKSEVWQVEMIGNTDVYSFALAETAKELAQV